MFTLSQSPLSQGLPTDLLQKLSRPVNRNVQAPASDFWHNGRFNMGPAICLTMTLSLVSWAGIIFAGFHILPLI